MHPKNPAFVSQKSTGAVPPAGILADFFRELQFERQNRTRRELCEFGR